MAAHVTDVSIQSAPWIKQKSSLIAFYIASIYDEFSLGKVGTCYMSLLSN